MCQWQACLLCAQRDGAVTAVAVAVAGGQGVAEAVWVGAVQEWGWMIGPVCVCVSVLVSQ